MPAPLTTLLPVIAEGAAAIEAVFLSAGTELGRCLDGFRTLTDDLKGLAAELDAGGMAEASAGLSRMTEGLRDVGGRLPADSRVLASLLGTNKGLGRRFDDLIDDMRMMVVVSRAARLEAVASDDQRTSLDAFSRTIDEQIGAAQSHLDASAADHARLTVVLDRAARDHFAFDTGFGTRLAGLATELDEALALMGRRRNAGLALMGEAATRARAITQAAGVALVSLQIGDNTRQRLEHVHFGLDRAAAIVPEEGGDATVALLCRLQEAQLRDAVASFEAEGASILKAFARLGRETDGLVTAGQATCGRAGEGEASSMAAFKARMTDGLDLVVACDASRRGVGGAIGALRAMLDTLGVTLAALMETSGELIIVAMNVGLKAGRLGTRGRGLVSVAAELKRLSGQISSHTEGLLAAFEAVRRDAEHFGPPGAASTGGPVSLADEAHAILAGIDRGDARLATVLGAVDRTVREFDATVRGATQAFAAAIADTARLTEVADQVGSLADRGPFDADAVASAARDVDDLALPLYTMAQERDIHAAIVGAAPTADGREPEHWAA